MMTPTNLRELVLAVALFFNPFGYNELFAFTMTRTGSYWKTSAIFYAFSGSLFVVYSYLKIVEKRKKRTHIIEGSNI